MRKTSNSTDAGRADFARPPQRPPTDPKEFGKWAQSLVGSGGTESRAKVATGREMRDERKESKRDEQKVERKGLRDGILMVLRSRGDCDSYDVGARILACGTLRYWVRGFSRA